MHILIIGGGQAAAQVIISLRTGGFEGKITLIGAEDYLPYQRPPLSKKFLSGALEAERLFFRPRDFYTSANIELILGDSVVQIAPDAKTVACAGGRVISYDRLVLATGANPRALKIEGRGLDNIFDLRGLDDVQAIRRACAAHARARAVIIGAGYIGLETAASLRQMGHDVCVLEAASRPLARVAHPIVSDFLTRLHHEEGVMIRTDCIPTRFVGDVSTQEGRVQGVGVKTADGGEEIIDADFVIIGIGVNPATDLASAAGLAVDNGIVVDELGRTAHADIYAAGDCTNHPNDLLGTRLRLESVHNAIEQGKAVASSLLDNPTPYHQIPWFWSDQYDVKLQIAGFNHNATHHIIRGDTEKGRSFAMFYLNETQLICVEAVNRPAEFMAARQLIAQSRASPPIDPAKLADETIAPKTWIPRK